MIQIKINTSKISLDRMRIIVNNSHSILYHSGKYYLFLPFGEFLLCVDMSLLITTK
jgi:hypothetical protein